MRLGKTEVAIRWALSKVAASAGPEKILVVAPLSTIPGAGWEGELRSHGIDPVLLIGHQKKWLDLLDDDSRTFYVTNYERLRVCPALVDAPWKVVILDESTLIRTPTSKISKLVLSGFNDTENKAILTGMPNPENLMDFFNQMKFISSDGTFLDCKNWWQCRDRYFNKVGFDWFPRKGTRELFKDTVHELCSVLTRKQAGVGNQRIREVRYVDMPPKVWKAYKKAERDFEIGTDETKWIPVLHTWLARLTGGIYNGYEHDAKVREIISLLNNELKDEQVVIWFRFNAELAKVKAALDEEGIKCTSITGQSSPEERGIRLKLFQDGKRRVLLGQARCARFGLNCSAADTAIWYSRWPDGEINGQAQERIEHLGKKATLLDLDIVVRNSIDEDLYQCVRDKITEANRFTNRLIELLKQRRKNAVSL